LLGQETVTQIDLDFDDPAGDEHELGTISATIEVARRILDTGM
jgi:hypothetical protein